VSVPAYPDYKDSGVPWLGEVPSHWQLLRFKNLLRERDARSVDGIEELLSVSAYTGITPKSESTGEGDFLSRAESLEGYKLCKHNDLVMNIMLAWNRGLGVTKYDGIVSPAYCVFELGTGLHPDFCNYAVRADEYTGYFKAHSAGVIDSRLRLYPDKFGALICACPPQDEQTAIAAFLDRETAKIDALVAEQERLIVLLKEKRQAVISHAVTKGLNPNAPMKDSGIEWLGEVPAHWEVAPLKRHWSVTDCKHITAEFVADGYPLASIREVQSQFVQLDNAKQTTIEFFEALREGERDPRPGDLIFSRNATVGEVAQVHPDHPPFAMGQDVCLLRKLLSGASSDFLQSTLKSSVGEIQMANLMIGSTFKRINVEEIRNLLIPFPPPKEQAEIACHVLDLAAIGEDLVAEAQSATSLLHERRAALISAAVTGKIDVRGLVSRELEAA
jgi:type I restriction enzyme S subunit